MPDTQLPGAFGDVQPMLEHYGYLVGTPRAVGLLAGEHIAEIYDEFERYKWYVIGALVIVVAIVITHRVRRRRAHRAA